MAIVPCCRLPWLLILCVASLTSGWTQALSFPGYISGYPTDQYVIKGQNFSTSCDVTISRTHSRNTWLSFMWRSSNEPLQNSSNVIIILTRNRNQLKGRLIIHNALFSNNKELICTAFGYVKRKLVNVSQSSVIHSLAAVPFVITNFPDGELQLDPRSPYTLQCIVTVDRQFPLRAVSVSIRYYPISLDTNMLSQVYANKEEINEESRMLTVNVHIGDVEQKVGGIFECTAMTKAIENVTISKYSTYNRTRISKVLINPHYSSDDNSDKNLLTLLCVFSAITITLLILFTFLVVMVIWTKRHRSKNYPLAPFPGTIPIAGTNAKCNNPSDSSEISAVNKIAVEPAMAFHITPQIQSVSSTETDV